jgi:hypothetical protein
MPEALTETREVPMLDVRAAPAPETFNAEARTVTFIASTGARGLRRSWMHGDYYEELDMSETSIRMDRLNNGAPFLNTHSSWEVGDVLGVVDRAWIENGQLMVSVRFSQREDVASILQDVADGILRHVSIGYMVHEYQVTEQPGDLDVRRAVDWEPMEVSLVPMGFDDAAVSRSADRKSSQAKIVKRAAGPSTQEEADMPTDEVRSNEAPAATETPDVTLTQDDVTRAANEASQRAVQNERTRVSEIQSAVRAAKLEAEFADELIREGVTVDAARQRIIERWAEQDTTEEVSGVRTSVDHRVVDNMRAGATNALLARGGVEELTDDGRHFAGMSLLRLCEDLLARQGVNVRGMNQREIATRALSTSDLANIAGSVFNRTLLMGYESAPRTFVGVFRQASASDFRAVNRVRLSGAPALEEVKENGEFKYGKVTDEKETYSLATYGKILPFTRQTIINDDMDALTRVPMMFGRAAADLESDLVWAILMDNAALQDGTALFHSDHGNLAGSGGAIDVTTIGAARAAMRKQTGMEGRLINVMPRHVIVGADAETTLEKFLTEIRPSEQANAIPTSMRSLNPVVEPRLTGNAWYIAADYNQVDTVEYCYLEGNQGVYIETREGFNIDGIEIKARHDFAAKAIDYRGLYKNPGA